MKKFIFILLFSFYVFGQSPDLFINPIEATITIPQVPVNGIVRYADLYQPSSNFFDQQGNVVIDNLNSLTIRLFDNQQFVILKKIVNQSDGKYLEYSWAGSFEGAPDYINTYFYVRKDGSIKGLIELGRYNYNITIANHITKIEEIDTSLFPVDIKEDDFTSEVVLRNGGPYNPNAHYDVNLLVAYTPEVSENYTDEQLEDVLADIHLHANVALTRIFHKGRKIWRRRIYL